MRVNGNALSGCRTLDVGLCNQKGRRSLFKGNKRTHSLLFTPWWKDLGHKKTRLSHGVYSHAPPLFDVQGMATTFQMTLICVSSVKLLIKNLFCRCQKQACGDRFNSICLECVCVCVLSPTTELVPLRAKQNTK